MFLLYFMWRLRKLSGITVVYHGRIQPQRCSNFTEGRLIHAADMTRWHGSPGLWYLIDGVTPPQDYCRTLLVTSPNKDIWWEFAKQQSWRRTMPVWSIDEIERCRRLCFPRADKGLVEEAYKQWGGIARYVLEKLRDEPAQQLLSEAIVSANLKTLVDFAGAREAFSDQVSHRLLHFSVRPDFITERLVFASDFVATSVYQLLFQRQQAELQRLLQTSSGTHALAAFRGIFFEELAHTVLGHGATLRARSLAMGRSLAEERWEQSASTKVFVRAAELVDMSPGTYGRPATGSTGHRRGVSAPTVRHREGHRFAAPTTPACAAVCRSLPAQLSLLHRTQQTEKKEGS